MTTQVALLSPAGTDQRLTVSSAVVTLSSFGADASHVFWDCQNNDVMVTFDGSDPTSSNGHRLYAGDSGMWSLATATAARFIRQGASDGVIQATPMRY